MNLPEFPQIDLRKKRRRPRAAVPQTEDVRPIPPARPRGPRGGRAVCQVASRTKPDIWYTVYIVEGGRLFCSCPDFVHRRRHRGEECKHLRGLREEYGFTTGMLARDSAIPIPSSVSELSLPRFLIIDIPGGSP
jgi:hypothetical protein